MRDVWKQPGRPTDCRIVNDSLAGPLNTGAPRKSGSDAVPVFASAAYDADVVAATFAVSVAADAAVSDCRRNSRRWLIMVMMVIAVECVFLFAAREDVSDQVQDFLARELVEQSLGHD
jgi:hypothetical protein